MLVKTPDLGDLLMIGIAAKRMYCCESPDRFLIVTVHVDISVMERGCF